MLGLIQQFPLPIFTPELLLILMTVTLLMVGIIVSNNNKLIVKNISFVALPIVLLLTFFIPDNFHILNSSTYFIDDRMAILAKIILVIGFFAILMMYNINSYLPFELIPIMSLCVVGMMIMSSTNNLIILYIAIEIQSLATYVLVSLQRPGSVNEAGIKYFVLGSLASGLILFSISYIYGFTGSVDIITVNKYIMQSQNISIAITFALTLLLSGICFKLSLAPFHFWTPDIYQGAPTIVTAFISSLPKLAMTVLLARLLHNLYIPLTFWLHLFELIAILSLIVGAVGAYRQQNLKRLIGYSTITNVGLILLALIASPTIGFNAAFIYVIIYMLTNIGFFAILQLFQDQSGKPIETFEQISGLAKKYPLYGLLLTFIVLSMAGIPPLAGFFTKFYVIYSLIAQGHMLYLAVIAAVSSVIASFYYLRIIKQIYMNTGEIVIDMIPAQFTVRMLLYIVTLIIVFFPLVINYLYSISFYS